MGHEKPEACGDRPPMCEIYGKDHNINNHMYNVITYKGKKERRYLYDLVKYGNYISIN